jgi:hypothetical protein
LWLLTCLVVSRDDRCNSGRSLEGYRRHPSPRTCCNHLRSTSRLDPLGPISLIAAAISPSRCIGAHAAPSSYSFISGQMPHQVRIRLSRGKCHIESVLGQVPHIRLLYIGYLIFFYLGAIAASSYSFPYFSHPFRFRTFRIHFDWIVPFVTDMC